MKLIGQRRLILLFLFLHLIGCGGWPEENRYLPIYQAPSNAEEERLYALERGRRQDEERAQADASCGNESLEQEAIAAIRKKYPDAEGLENPRYFYEVSNEFVSIGVFGNPDSDPPNSSWVVSFDRKNCRLDSVLLPQ